MALWRLFQYQAVTKPVAPPERITEDKWHQPWSEPRLTAKKSAGFAIALMASGVFQGPPPPPPSIDVAETTGSLQISKSFQYPAVQEPVPIPAEVITVDKWFVSLSEPVRLKLGLGAVQQQAFQPDTEPNVADLDSWYRPLNEPVRIKLGLRPEQQQYLQTDTEPNVSFSWFAGLSEPVRIKQGLSAQQQKDLWWTFFPTEVITLDKWYNWLSEPVRLKLGLTAQQQQFFQPDTEPQVSFGWIYGLSEPVRVKAGLGSYLQQTFTADTEPQVSFGWNYGYSEPVRTKPGLGAHLQRDLFWNNQLLENVTVDKWFGWLSEPVRVKPGLAAQQQQFFQPDTEPQVSFSWFAPLTEPVRLKPGLGAWQQQFFQPDTEPQVSFGWIYGLSEPVRVKQGLSVTQQKELWWTFFPTEIVTVDKWFNPLSEPVRVKPALQAGLQQFFQPDPAPQVSFSWFGWLSEPVRQKLGLTAQQQQFFQPDTEPQVSFGWSDGLSEPVRTRWFAAAQQQVLAWSTFTPTTFNDTKWFTPLSEPVRLKVGLQASLQQPFTFDTEPTVSFGWFEPLSEPVRLKIGLRADLQQFFTFDTEPTVSFSWSDGLSEPVRTRLFPAAQQQALVWSSFTPTTFNDTKWFTPLSEPVRIKQGLRPDLQQVFTFDTEPTVSFGWSDGLSEPVRTRLFQTAQQSPLAWSGFTPAATTDIRWFTPLSEPVRVKAGLSAAQQQFWTIGKLPDVQSIISQTWDYVPFEYSLLYPTSVEPPRVTPTTVDSWFVPLSEPVRVKPSLLTGRQQFFAIGTKPSVSFSWFEWLSDPVRLKPGTHVSRQSVTTIGTKPTVSFSWFEPFSEPVRVKLGLRPSAQQFLALVKAAPFPEAVLEAKWHQPWSEPVRYRWFSPAQQQFLAQSPRITAQNITISLTATETGDIFSGNLRIGFCPQADVSIIEVVTPNASNTSTVYVPTVFAEVSIIEIPQNSDRVLQTIALTDAFGNVLTDAFGNALTITQLVLVTGAEVVVDVSVIEKC